MTYGYDLGPVWPVDLCYSHVVLFICVIFDQCTQQALKADEWLQVQARVHACKIGRPELVDFSRYDSISHMIVGERGASAVVGRQELGKCSATKIGVPGVGALRSSVEDEESREATAFIGLGGTKATKSSLWSFLRKRLG